MPALTRSRWSAYSGTRDREGFPVLLAEDKGPMQVKGATQRDDSGQFIRPCEFHPISRRFRWSAYSGPRDTEGFPLHVTKSRLPAEEENDMRIEVEEDEWVESEEEVRVDEVSIEVPEEQQIEIAVKHTQGAEEEPTQQAQDKAQCPPLVITPTLRRKREKRKKVKSRKIELKEFLKSDRLLKSQSSPMLGLTSDIKKRIPTLEELDSYVVQHAEYQAAVMIVIKLMVDKNLTLNHVNSQQALLHLQQSQTLRAPAFEYAFGHTACNLDRDDLCKGLGYYHFNRISVGTMSNGPSFNLSNESHIMLFIDPHVLSKRHFIACQGNAAKLSLEKCPGRLHTKMSTDGALQEALRAVKKLDEMIRQGVKNVPLSNEIAIFCSVESSFIYHHFAVVGGSDCLSSESKFPNRAFEVVSSTGRYEAGKKAIMLSTMPAKKARRMLLAKRPKKAKQLLPANHSELLQAY